MGLIRKIIEIEYERYKMHKAMRILQKQEWSVEFLAMLMRKAVDSGMTSSGVVLEIKHKDTVLNLRIENVMKTTVEESIFDKLDNEAAVNDFIAKNSTRG